MFGFQTARPQRSGEKIQTQIVVCRKVFDYDGLGGVCREARMEIGYAVGF